jgi:glycine dehydrogenase
MPTTRRFKPVHRHARRNLSHPLAELEHRDEFIARHIGPDEHAIAGMLASIGTASLSNLIAETVPAGSACSARSTCRRR